MVLVWVGVIILTFIIANVVPRDPVRLRLGPRATADQVAALRKEYGLDLPLPMQFIRYVENLAQGNLGTSLWSERPVLDDLVDYVPATVELSGAALLITLLVGVPLGVAAAAKKGSALDRVASAIATFAVASPAFWIGTVGQIVFYRALGWFPLQGQIAQVLGPPARITGLFVVDSVLSGDVPRLLSSLDHLVLPALALSLWPAAAVFRQVRSSVLETMSTDYVRTAKAKGLPARAVLWGHVFRNSLLPLLSIFGFITAALLSGTFVIEVVFGWPGVGWYATQEILASDYFGTIAITLVIAVIVTTVNLIVDLGYSVVDPRIRYS